MQHTDVVTATVDNPRVEQTQHEGKALGWLTFGLILAELGAFIGVYLVLRSNVWSLRSKVAALTLPVVLVLGLKVYPDLGSGAIVALLAAIVATSWAASVLLRAAEHGRIEPRLGRMSAALVAALGVAVASAALSQVHQIGSYDLRDDAIVIAQAADEAGEEFGVIQNDNAWLESDGPDPDQLAALTGPGNARFVQLFEEARSRVDADRWLPAKDLGSCSVFPVVASTDAGIESVEGIAQFCDGPSRSGSYVTLTDR